MFSAFLQLAQAQSRQRSTPAAAGRLHLLQSDANEIEYKRKKLLSFSKFLEISRVYIQLQKGRKLFGELQ